MIKEKLKHADFHIKVKQKLIQKHNIIQKIPNAFLPYVPYPQQIKLINCVNKSIQNSSNALIQSPTGTGKTICLLTGALSALKTLNDKTIKIFYLTRTHSQISQVVEQLRKTIYQVRVNIVASRDHLCINPNFKEMKGKILEKACYDSVCNKSCLYNESDKKLRRIPHAMTLQNFRQQCKKQLLCPFFYSKQLTQKTQITILPFNYFLDWKIFDSFSHLIRNSVIIFDQAHNVDNLAQQGSNLQISIKQLDFALSQIKILRKNLKQDKYEQKNMRDIKIVENILEKLRNSINQQNKKIFLSKSQLQEFLYTSTSIVDPDDHFHIIDGLQLNNSLNIFQLFNQITKYFYKSSINSSSYSNVYNSLQKICRLFNQKEFQKNFIVKIYEDEHQITKSKNKAFRLKCLNPSLAFQKLKSYSPRSIILASGTLGNLDNFQKYLGIPFSQKLSISGFITSNQLYATIISNSCQSNYSFQFTHLRKNNEMQHKQLIQQIKMIESKIPINNGIIVAFSTYWLLDKIVGMIVKGSNNDNRLGIEQKGIRRKIFYQSKSSDVNRVFNEYSNEIKNSQNGAILFIVMKGRFSEGINFNDQLCRCLIVVGIPFLPSNQQSIQQKIKFLTENYSSEQSNQWYMNQTFQAVNQTIGRVIRNKKDYGVVILIDKRYEKKDNLNRISDWFKKCLKGRQEKKRIDMYQDIEGFFQRKQIQKETEKQGNQKIEKCIQSFQKSNTKVKGLQKRLINVSMIMNKNKKKHLKLKLQDDQYLQKDSKSYINNKLVQNQKIQFQNGSQVELQTSDQIIINEFKQIIQNQEQKKTIKKKRIKTKTLRSNNNISNNKINSNDKNNKIQLFENPNISSNIKNNLISSINYYTDYKAKNRINLQNKQKLRGFSQKFIKSVHYNRKSQKYTIPSNHSNQTLNNQIYKNKKQKHNNNYQLVNKLSSEYLEKGLKQQLQLQQQLEEERIYNKFQEEQKIRNIIYQCEQGSNFKNQEKNNNNSSSIQLMQIQIQGINKIKQQQQIKQSELDNKKQFHNNNNTREQIRQYTKEYSFLKSNHNIYIQSNHKTNNNNKNDQNQKNQSTLNSNKKTTSTIIKSNNKNINQIKQINQVNNMYLEYFMW